ncbi:MAG: histidinol-phosphate transaminase [Lachnospiraceae bacterium]|nr:histidinol-phosphate transaminase [Lachnospiraceae bacterium]
MKWEDNVRKVIPYVPGEQPNKENMIKLNTNECPYPPTPNVKKAVEAFDTEKLRLYPDTNATPLADALSDYYHVDKKQIFIGVGSDDVLAIAFMTFFNSNKKILFPDITYSFYDVWAELYRIPYQVQPLDEEFKIRREDYMIPNGGVILANPNAPTGEQTDLATIEEIIQANQDVVVIIDEAYIDFGGESSLPFIEKYDNVLVVQTFSKSRAMAGLRVGYAFGSEKLIQYMNDVKFSFNSYTMNLPAQVFGAEAVKDDKYFRETVQKIVHTRERVKGELRELGFVFTDSMSNFIFATHPRCQAVELQNMLREKSIYVRHFTKERIDNYLRISIGTDAEMDTLLGELKAYIQSK